RKTGKVTAVCTSETMTADVVNVVMIHAAATVCIQIAILTKAAASHKPRNALLRNGAHAEPSLIITPQRFRRSTSRGLRGQWLAKPPACSRRAEPTRCCNAIAQSTNAIDLRFDPITRLQEAPGFQTHTVAGAGKHQVPRAQTDACIQIVEQF